MHDGDSIVFNRERIRILNIDTPELDGQCASERRLAIQARNQLLAYLNSGDWRVSRDGKDRYGRTLANISVNGQDVGSMLIRAGVARPWEGRRMSWCDG